MTTLIRLTLNGRHRAVHHDLADVHAMHQRVMSLLPDGLGASPRAQTSTLYRIEDVPPNPRLLIQTGHPNTLLDRLPDGYHLDVASLDLTALYERLTTGITVRYAITANPSKRAAHGPQAGKRIALNGYDAVHAWWARRATASGLDVDEHPVDIRPAPAATGTRQRAQRRDAIIHRATVIEGSATVTDPARLTTALNAGIGAGKAHGLGLLTVVPIAPSA
jgi:CRISPR system Cascade subunit CasE